MESQPILQSNSKKPIQFGSGIIVKELDDKILICAENTTILREGNFKLVGIKDKEIVVEAGEGVKISSRHPNVLVISADHKMIEEKMFDLKTDVNKRLESIEKAFSIILKSTKK